MIRKTFLALLFGIITNLSYSQSNYFNNIFQINGLWTYGRSIVIRDSNYYVAALTYDTIDTIYSVRRLSICKFDYNGNLITRKGFGWGSRNYWVGYSGCFQKTYDYGFFSVGAVEDTNEVNSYLVKFNSNLDTVFFKEYKDTIVHYLEFQQGKETSDKGFIMVGTLPGSGTYDQDIFVLKADSLGNEQWRKIINLGAIEYARNVIQTPDKGYLLGCYTYTSTNYLSGDGRIIKLDSLGNFEWNKSIGGINRDGVPIISLSNDSNYLAAIAYAYTTVLGVPEISEYKIEVLKLDINGNVIWNKQFDSIRPVYLPQAINVLEDGSILISGILYVNYYGSSWLLKLNSNGDSILYRNFKKLEGMYQKNNVQDFNITKDGSIIICGYLNTDTSYTYLWLAKMDSLGCLQPGCQYVGVEELQKEKAGELKVYPNPAKDYFIIEFDNAEISKDAILEITDMLGRKMQSIKINTNKIQINTQNLAKGLYHCYLINDNKIIKQAKISKE